MLHRIAARITDSLIRNRIADRTKEEFYIYGLEITLEKILSYTAMGLMAVYFNMFIPTVLFLISFLALRVRTGGFHAPNYITCFLTTIAICLLCIKVAIPFFTDHMGAVSVMLAAACVIIVLFAPVNHPNLDLEGEEIAMCRKASRLVLLIELVCILSAVLLDINAVCIVSSSMGVILCAALIIVAKILRQEVQEVEK